MVSDSKRRHLTCWRWQIGNALDCGSSLCGFEFHTSTLLSMEKIVVGQIEGHDVLYMPEKDYVFCKNTVLPLHIMLEALRNNADRVEVPEKNLVIKLSEATVDMGCLTTTKENLYSIKKNISKIKD